MKKPKMGRPAIAKSEYRGALIGARFAPDESKIVHDYIKRSKQVKSDWIRKTLLEAASDAKV